MTTIVYKNGILAADTMVTILAKNKDDNVHRAKSQEIKIFSPHNLLFEGEPILAMGSAGNVDFIDKIKAIGFQIGHESYFQTDSDYHKDFSENFKKCLEVDGRYAETGLLDLGTFLAVFRGASGYFSDYTNSQILKLKEKDPKHPFFDTIKITTSNVGGGHKQKNAVKKPNVPVYEKPQVKQKAFSLLIVTKSKIVIYESNGFFNNSHVFLRKDVDHGGAVIAIGSGGRYALFLNRLVTLSAVDLVIAASGFDTNTGFDVNYIDTKTDLCTIETVSRDELPGDIVMAVMGGISDEYISRRLQIRAKKALMKRRIDIKDAYPNHDLKAMMLFDVMTEKLEKEKHEEELRIKIQNEIIEELNNLVEDVNTLPYPYRRPKE